MKISVYVDGSGGASPGYGYYVKETGVSSYEEREGITNNEAEYMAVIAALKRFAESGDEIEIYSDSKVVVSQLNHEYGINKPRLRELAREAWPLIAKSQITLRWIPRKENLAGRMLGS